MPLDPRLEGLFRRQVSAAAVKDQRRKHEDETKKRAIVSASNYGEFKALVDGCHLRPLARDDFSKQAERQLNPHAARVTTLDLAPGASDPDSSNSKATDENAQIRNQAQLSRQWQARDKDPDGQCSWLLEQPQEGLQRIFSVDIDPQLLLQLLKALASHLSTLAASRCNSCCCCCQTRQAAPPAKTEAKAPNGVDASAFCCRIAYRVYLTAGFLTFLSQLNATAKGARLLLQQELQQVTSSFEQSLAALHSPVVPPTAAKAPNAAVDDSTETVASEKCACCCGRQLAETKEDTTANAATGEAAGSSNQGSTTVAECCQTQQAVKALLQTLGAPELRR
ncbi:hypothetical protein, conserved [Eimeria necatrix]|uniref:Dynein attachment factor N-terminal domain-containing protein n=1 Tax=Eimeria necatrix TaxID=51315 RepID=U6MK92_9EIME|nr:hypothetical protein, conserved [Eimeria necatrix]CDJ64441.1 hypothetical protein, conserved [Eimeria necatrix]